MFQLWPHRPHWDDVCTDRNANNEHLKSLQLCSDLALWEPYGLLWVRLRLGWMAFLSILGRHALIFHSSLFPTSGFHKSILQTSPLLLLLLLFLMSAASSETLIPFWVGWGYNSYCSRSNKCLHNTMVLGYLTHEWILGLKSYSSLEMSPSARKPCVWFLFVSPHYWSLLAPVWWYWCVGAGKSYCV